MSCNTCILNVSCRVFIVLFFICVLLFKTVHLDRLRQRIECQFTQEIMDAIQFFLSSRSKSLSIPILVEIEKIGLIQHYLKVLIQRGSFFVFFDFCSLSFIPFVRLFVKQEWTTNLVLPLYFAMLVLHWNFYCCPKQHAVSPNHSPYICGCACEIKRRWTTWVYTCGTYRDG